MSLHQQGGRAHARSTVDLPLSAGAQWELVDEAADRLEPAFNELVRQAAYGTVVYNDDTNMKILDLAKEMQNEALKKDSVLHTSYPPRPQETCEQH